MFPSGFTVSGFALLFSNIKELQTNMATLPSTALSDPAKMLWNQQLRLRTQNSPKSLIMLSFGFESDTAVLASQLFLASKIARSGGGFLNGLMTRSD
jgi:hypothetical protein